MVISLSASAKTENNSNKMSDGGVYTAESSTDAKELGTKEAESTEESEEAGSEPDSSYYSVNKFNFLFYFVYKMNYMDEETEVDNSDD
ncbi:hypothetical protein [Reichenbachiella sp.]|uniref:hypothetical protein n=1 Tax=Reichenbachiella sp. TaxID=2184521 RepID=UPI003B59F3F9